MKARLQRLTPRPAIRLRLTGTYGLVFLVTGAGLLTIGYFVVRHNINAPLRVRDTLQRLGVTAPTVRADPADGSGFIFVAREVRKQLVASALHRLLAEYLLALGL